MPNRVGEVIDSEGWSIMYEQRSSRRRQKLITVESFPLIVDCRQIVFVGLINREAEKKQSSEYAEYNTQSMCKVICPMDEYGESRTVEPSYGKNDKKWPVQWVGS